MVMVIKDLPYEERLCQLNLPSVTFCDTINVFKLVRQQNVLMQASGLQLHIQH